MEISNGLRKLRIGQISPLNLPIPPKKYGGSEVIIDFLCKELTKKGHEVFLFASGDSKENCKIYPVIDKALWVKRTEETAPYYAYEMAYIGRKARELKLDILHDHLGPWALTLYGQTEIPIIHTLHVPFKNQDRVWAYNKLSSKLVSISLAQRKPAKNLNYVANIYNGIDVENYPFNNKPQDYYLWTGELSPRKGIYEVIKIAKMLKLELILAGRIPPVQQKNDYIFFQKFIKKELNRNGITYLGEKSKEQLKKYYKNAKAFLFPLQWEEPFGLTMAEAMACGTPVIAFNRGSVSEVVKNNETGFVVKPFNYKGETNIAGFIAAISQVERINRSACRQRVIDNFSSSKMAEEYEKLYYKIINLKQ